jgi:hypothetical protein
MNKEESAAILDGRQYRAAMGDLDADKAKDYGLVVVYGASDDLMEFEGAIVDEVDCYNGGTAYLHEDGLLEIVCLDCPHLLREQARCKIINAVWCPPGGGSWAYETEIPHATFNIYEEDELYCVGIVFEMASLKRGPE